MPPCVAVVAPGNMGAAVGRRLRDGGARVLTCLDGRSAASAARAAEAGMEPVPLARLAEAEIILSIVPPGSALALADGLSQVLASAARKPVYVDCNAVSPETVSRIAGVVAASGAPFVDAGIIGGPPRQGKPGPRFYASGPAVGAFARLGAHGLEILPLEGGIGAASALKLSYAGMTKGLTALGAAMFLAASRAGIAEALHAEMAHSQTELLARLGEDIPRMYDKAHRWVAEMEEIARFAGADAGTRSIYEGAAQLYQQLALDGAAERREIAALDAFVALGPTQKQ